MDLPYGYCPVSQRIIGIDTLGNWKNLCGLKATEISPPYQERKPREISKSSATIKEEARTILCDGYCMAIELTNLACAEIKWI